MNDNEGVLILSGGLDSTTLLYDLIDQGRKIYTISFDYGQRHSKELIMAARTCQKLGINHKIVDLSTLSEILGDNALTGTIDVPLGHYEEENMKQTVVPNRNMIMMSMAIGYAISLDIENVYYGAHHGDFAIYPDCRPTFVDAIQKVANLCHYEPIRVLAPYLYMDKIGIVTRGLELNVPYEDTWTCYAGKLKACGKCGSCTERLEAFAANNVIDPIKYEE